MFCFIKQKFTVTIIMNNKFSTILTILFTIFANAKYSTVLAEPDSKSVESMTWQFEYDNDFFFKKDNKISGGWSLQKSSAIAHSWDQLEGVPDLIKAYGESIPTLTKEGLVYRAGISIGQLVQTPTDLSRSDLIVDDVPYAGALTLQASWYAYNNYEFRGFEITTGIVGPLSYADQVQKTIHKVINSPSPKGWDNQLKNEPIINLNYMRKQKFWNIGYPAALSFDASINGNLALGNLFTEAAAALEMRFGYNMPQGFVYIPDSIGFSMHYNASLKPANSQIMSFYSSLILRGSTYLHNIFLDGNTYQDSHRVEKEYFVEQIIAGIHYERRDWAIHFSLMSSSNNVNTSKAPAAERREQVGTIDFEWRY